MTARPRIGVVNPARLFASALWAVAVILAAPIAAAAPIPNPDPVPVPGQGGAESGGSCMAGEVFENGACVSQSESSAGGAQTRISAPSVGSSQSRTTNSYVDPLYTVPNINGDPCTGQWESVACYAMHSDSAPAVQPRSTLSSSP